MTATHRVMPEPFRGEPADEYRDRLREFFDFHATPGETLESSRRSWVQVCSRHEVASGLDFLPDDPHPSVRVPSNLPKPSKPIWSMTEKEQQAFYWSVWEAMGKTFDAAPLPNFPAPVVVTYREVERMLEEIAAGWTWGSPGTEVPNTAEHHTQWDRLAELVEAINDAGGQLDEY